MPKRRKKTFPCGHKGYGQVCHRCAQVLAEKEKQQQELDAKRQEKVQWEATFEGDPIDLRALPTHVVLKAREIIAGLEAKQNYREFKGKRLRHDRFVISIPITRNYRMICHDGDGGAVPKEVLSHEEYNTKKPGS